MKRNFKRSLLSMILAIGMMAGVLPAGVLPAAGAAGGETDTFQSDFSSADGFRAVQDRAKNASMTLSVSGGVLNISGRQTASGHAWNYQTVYSGLNIPVRAGTKLTYVMVPNGDMTGDYYSLHLAVDLKFSDGTYLSQLDVEDENCVGMNPSDQGEAKAMFYSVQNISITALGAYEQCLGKTITDILVGYENEDGQGSNAFTATIDDLRIGPSEKVYDELTDYVVTTRGTNPVSPYELSRGACHPFVALPHGFNFWTPENVGWMGIYDYSAGYISSFRCSHQANFHLGDPAAWNFMVTSGGSGNTAYDRDDEIAQAHYYSVEFNKKSGQAAGTRVELSPTDHGLSVRVTYDAGVAKRGITVNGLRVSSSTNSFSGTVSVSCTNSSWNTTLKNMYIYGVFDTDVQSVQGNTAYFAESAKGQTVVTMHLATSFISVEQAKSNYEQELGGKTFDEVFAAAKAIWNDKLSTVEIEGATEDQLITFYSNMYRLFLYPNHLGEYTGKGTADGWQYRSPYTQQVVDGKMYYNNGFWDTYRTAWPAYSLLEPSQESEMLNGFLYHYRDCGWIPRWSAPNGLDCMAGTSSDVIYGDALMRGIEFDVETAYKAALKNANMSTYAGGMGGRKGMNTGIFLGYIPNTTSNGMSWTLDGCLNDLGIAQMAKAVGDMDNYAYLMNRALSYSYLFDTENQWFRGKTVTGRWSVEPLNPLTFGGDYEETNAWNMAFSAPHDGQGLVNLYGSREALAAKLDEFFGTPFPSSTGIGGPTMINEIVQVKMGNYQHNNEPSLHIPYMYLYAGRPDRTQETVRQVLRQCYTGSQIGGGYIGDEDNGAQAAWYIFSAMGIYPLSMGTGELVFGSPLFTKVTVHLENGKELVISAPNNSSENIYVAGLTINGKPYNKTSILQTELTKNGAVIEFEMTNKPASWGTAEDAAPTSLTADREIPNPKADQTVEAVCDGAQNAALLSDNDSATGTTLKPTNGKISVFYSFDEMQCVTMYTLTSDQNATKAPNAFALYGSSDGETWTLLDERKDVTFPWGTYTRPFAVANAGYYTEYRLDIHSSNAVTLSEIELMANNAEAASRDALKNAISYAESKDTSDLSDAEKALVADAIAAAKAVANDAHATQEAIQDAYDQLMQALENVFLLSQIKPELQDLCDIWKNATQGFWSAQTWAALQTALTEAQTVLNREASTAEDYQNAKTALQNAADSLTVGYDHSLSHGKHATSNYAQPGEGAANAVDGNAGSKWCSTVNDKGAYWLEVDLGKVCRVDSWAVMGAANEPGGTGYLSSEYRLQMKNEDGQWITVMTADPANANVFTAKLEEAAVGQYFRLYVPNPACPLDGFVRIYEFHVYGEEYVPEVDTEPKETTTEPDETETEPVEDTIKFWSSVDHINGMGPHGTAHFSGMGGNYLTGGTTIVDAVEQGVAILDDCTMTIGGWLAVDGGGTARFVFSVDGGVTWLAATGGHDGEPLPGHYDSLGFVDATKLGMFPANQSPIVADLSDYAGQTVDVTFAAIAASDNKTVISFITVTNYAVPKAQSEETTTEPEITPPEPGHTCSFGAWSIIKQATCTETGTRTRWCSCGETQTERISAKGHTESDWIVDVAAKPGVDGSKHVECIECHLTLKTELIPALPTEPDVTDTEPEETTTEPEETTVEPEATTTEPTTEPTTEADTDEESRTEEPTESITTPSTQSPETESETDAPRQGCGSALGMGCAGILTAVAAAVVRKKKSEENE